MKRANAGRYGVVIKSCWIEWLVARQITTGNGESCLIECAYVPGWFRLHELGLAVSDGPSIFWTLDHLVELNRAHRAQLAGPRREASKPKLSAKARRKLEQAEARRRRQKWRAVVSSAGAQAA